MTFKSPINSTSGSSERESAALPSRGALLTLLLLTTFVALFIDEVLHWFFPQRSLSLILLVNLGILFGVLGPLGYVYLFRPYQRLVSGQRRTEDALRRSEAFTRATLDSLPDHIAIVNAQGEILAVNQGWRRFAEQNGPVRGNVNEGANYFAVCRAVEGEDAETANAFVLGIQAVLSGERKDFALEYPCHSPDQQRWFIGRVSHLEGFGESLVVVSHRDITARRLAEESLRVSETLYRTIFETSGHALLTITAEGLILHVNPQFESMTGYRRDEVEGIMNWRTFIAPADLPTMERYNEELWARGDATPVNAEIRFFNRQGQARYALMAASRLIGTPHSIVFLTDFTLRRAMNEALLENQTKLFRQHQELHRLFRQVEDIKKEWEQTLDCLEDVVVLTDAEGRIRRCNSALRRLVGEDFEQLRDLPLADLLADFTVLAGDAGGSGVELYDPGGARYFLARTYSFAAGDQAPTGSVVTVQDITRIRRITADLARANQELEAKRRELQHAYDDLRAGQQRILQQEKMASIGQLAAGVAHEINNPIGYVSSNLGTLDKYLRRLSEFLSLQARDANVGEELAAARRNLKVNAILDDLPDLLAESLEGTQRVKKIVQDLKNFSRLDSGEPVAADLVQVLESTVNIVWNEIKYKAELVRDFEALPPLVCHPQQLGQVFMNLLVNAAQAIDKRGTIHLSTRRRGAWVEVAVSDDGSGIAPEHHAKLFDPFFTTKEVGQGTGLGLSIAYEIVKKHGGEILVESVPGQGATFTVRLPLEAPGTGLTPAARAQEVS
ncbi:PAS domain-containing sensor histidine kinase [Geoalkalibacter halelectricus]|uniref:PAS domain-containing sensor histidine kinase n=1 Tax=Geoalkalibacter halelectricus TaxID=2847045 RepID=UPI003D1CB1FB